MKGYIDSNREFSPDFREQCETIWKAAGKLLRDIGGAKLNRMEAEQKYSSLAVTIRDQVQLFSVQGVMGKYLLNQRDVIMDLRLMKSDSDWKAEQKKNFLSGMEHHFGEYPDVRYPGHVAASPAGDPVTKALAELKCIWHEGSISENPFARSF